MNEGQLCGLQLLHIGDSTIAVTQFLMNPPHVAAPLPHFKDPRCKGIKQGLARVFIDVMPWDKNDLRTIRICLTDQRTQMICCILRKIFICVDKDNPVSMSETQRCISCGCEIICPCYRMDFCTKFCGSLC